MGYEAIRLQRPLAVDDIVSVHYFEYSSNYYFEGERHDFWEFLYVDKGELDVRAGDVVQHLKKGQIIFHKPGEFHALSANGVVAPNLVVVGFVCHGEAMRFFENRVLSVGDSGRALLARIVEEGEAAFSTPLNDPQTMQLARREGAPFGAEQLIGGRGRRKAHQPHPGTHTAGIHRPCEQISGGQHRKTPDALGYLPGQSGGPQLSAKDLSGKDGRRRNGILRHAEDRRGQAHDPGGHAQFHRDRRAAGL